MPREPTGIDYSVLSDAKQGPKRDKSKGRRVANSTLFVYVNLAPTNDARAAAARAEDFGPQSAACLKLACLRCARPDASMPHHEPPRSRGGTDFDALPLCDILRLYGVPGCHQLRHSQGEVTFWSEMHMTPDEAKEHVRLQAGLVAPPV